MQAHISREASSPINTQHKQSSRSTPGFRMQKAQEEGAQALHLADRLACVPSLGGTPDAASSGVSGTVLSGS